MKTYIISKDGEVKAELNNQESDINVIGKMQKLQSQSTHWAIKYEGWKVAEIDEETGIKSQWITKGDFLIISEPIK
jgi:hypothetical protein